jgi:hypothetical protein
LTGIQKRYPYVVDNIPSETESTRAKPFVPLLSRDRAGGGGDAPFLTGDGGGSGSDGGH